MKDLSAMETSTLNVVAFLIREGSEEFKDNLCDLLDKKKVIDEYLDVKLAISELIDKKLAEIEEELNTINKEELMEIAYSTLTAPGGE